MSRCKYARTVFIASLVVASASLLCVAPASALTVYFSFDNTYYVPGNGFPSGVAGIVTGEIDGLTPYNGSTTTYTSTGITAKVTSAPAGSGLFTGSYDMTNVTSLFGLGSGNEVVHAYFIDYGPGYLGMNWTSVAGGFAYLQSDNTCNASNSGASMCAVDTVTAPNDGTLAFSLTPFASATPLPAALPLFASGLGALGLLGWRKKRKVASLAA